MQIRVTVFVIRKKILTLGLRKTIVLDLFLINNEGLVASNNIITTIKILMCALPHTILFFDGFLYYKPARLVGVKTENK
jgi:hypothetical protein